MMKCCGKNTGPELTGDSGLIKMNGRMYDPVLGQFLNADPVIQFPGFTQSYNSYSYVMNNPLRFTDPTGYTASTDAFIEAGLDNRSLDQMLAELYGGMYFDVFLNSELSSVVLFNGKRSDLKLHEDGTWTLKGHIISPDEAMDLLFTIGGKLGAPNYLEEIETTLPKIKRGHNWSDIWDFSNIQKNFNKTTGWLGRGYRWTKTTPSGVFIDIWEEQSGAKATFKDFRIIQNSGDKMLTKDLLVKDLFESNSRAFSKYRYVLQLRGYIEVGEREDLSYLMSIATNDWSYFYNICNSILNR